MATVTWKVYAIGDGEGTVTGGGTLSSGETMTVTATPAEGSTLAYCRYVRQSQGGNPSILALNYDGETFSTTFGVAMWDSDGDANEYAFFFAKKAKVRLTLNGYRLKAHWDLSAHAANGGSVYYAKDAVMDADSKGRTVEYSLMRPYLGETGNPSGVLSFTINDDATPSWRIDRAKTDTDMDVLYDGGADFPLQMTFSFPLSCVDADTAAYRCSIFVWHTHDGKMLWAGDGGRPMFDGQGRLLCR